MRLLVVSCSPPLSSLRCEPDSRITPQPPGPGLPEQAPSVWITTFGRSAMSRPKAVIAVGLHALVEPQLAQIFVRVLCLHQGIRIGVDQIVGAGQKESERGTPRKRWQPVEL